MELRYLLLAVAITAVWGFNWQVSKVGVTDMPPLQFVALRCVAVAALLLPFVKPPGRHLPAVALLGTLTALALSFYFYAVKYIDTGIGAVLGQLQVLFSGILAALIFKDPFGWRRWLGVAVALAGTAVLMGTPTRASEYDAVAMIVAASLMSAFGFVTSKRPAHLHPLTLTGWGALFAAPVLALGSLGLESGQTAAIRGAPFHLWLGLAYNVLLVSIAGYTLWYFLIGRYSVNRVVPLTLLIPVFALIGGVAFYGETLTAAKIAGTVLVLIGVSVILYRRSAPASEAGPR